MQAIDLYDLWQSLLAAVNAQQGGWIKPQGNFEKWVNEVNLELFRERVKNFERDQQNSDDLAPFLLTLNVVLQQMAGKNYDLAPYPINYAAYASSRILYNENTNCGCLSEGNAILDGKSGTCKPYEDEDYKEIREQSRGADLCELSISKIPNQMWGNACDHAFKKPTPKSPIITQFDGGFKVAPKKLGIIILDYFKVPQAAVFAYTLGPDDNIIYNAAASTQLEWPVSMKGEFLARLIKRYGMYTSQETMYAQGEQERQINH